MMCVSIAFSYTDAAVEKWLLELDATGLSERSLVVFLMADHLDRPRLRLGQAGHRDRCAEVAGAVRHRGAAEVPCAAGEA